MVLVTVAALAIGAGIIAFALPKGGSSDPELVRPPTSYPADLVDAESLGAAGAPVVIELYSDFQCPACKLFVTEQLPRLLEEFVRPGILRIEARDIAFLGRGSRDESLELAAGARCAAQQDRYWPFHDYVFWNQGRENRGDHSETFISRIAVEAGIERAAFDACLAGPEVRAAITGQTTTALGSGVNSTPTLIVNGQSAVGVPNYDQLAGLIRQLAAAASPAPGNAASPEPTSQPS
jgi:protein-disulfide isomerase